ncbi:hypothetical protein OIU76_002612 [Salix suchowensis]|nr:hypothetical protein OIU76_002612 [Salix suchowensis]
MDQDPVARAQALGTRRADRELSSPRAEAHYQMFLNSTYALAFFGPGFCDLNPALKNILLGLALFTRDIFRFPGLLLPQPHHLRPSNHEQNFHNLTQNDPPNPTYNISHDWRAADLGRMFSNFGVLKVYVPNKLNKRQWKFGFVHFEATINKGLLLQDLNSIWIGTYKMRVNMESYRKK